MKKFLLASCLLMVAAFTSFSQNVFNPADAIVRYDKTKGLGTTQNPNPAKAGLQKWVSTPTNGISTGTDTYDASSYKQYFINAAGGKMAFRMKFPKTYSSNPTKKFPVMLFLHGGGEVGCPTNGGIYNNEKQVWLGGSLFLQRVNSGEFDGFLLYPQLVATDGCWGAWGTAASVNFTAILAMIDSMAKYVRADNDRLLITGLSGGGYGAWRMADAYPQRVAKIMPSSAAGSTTNRNAFVHIPIWFATGGKDPDPSPAQAQYSLNRMKEIGADIKYTIFPDLGHSIWYPHWREPGFVEGMNEVHKANPLVFFQHNEFCPSEAINAKLGLTPGFYAYEWQKDNVTIATRTNGVNTIVNAASVISFTGNEISVKSFGTYRARFKRTASSAWSDWSLKPAVIKTKSTTITPPITVSGIKSKVLPALDGSTTVPLQLPAGFTSYEWYRVSDNVKVGSAQIYNAPIGVYKARYTEQFGCGANFSPNFTVINANGTPKPDPVTNLTTTTLSATSARLNWSQNANETGNEVYRSTTAGGPYVLLTITAANILTYTDNTLAANTTYYYVVRSVNATGAAAKSNESSPNNGNKAPVIASLVNIFVKSDASVSKDFTVTDAAGDVVTVTIPYKPGFITLQKLSATSYRIIANPTIDNVGWKDIQVVATDNKGMFSTQTITVMVSDKNTRSAYVNFGSAGKTAPVPWNNWLGLRSAGNVLSALKDESNVATTFSVTMVTGWSTLTDLGHITGNNSGIFPDAVLQSGIADNGTARQIRIGGLSSAKRYNLMFVGSQNEGLVATTEFANGSQKAVMNARYNTNQSANLNNLIPDASGQILVTVTRTGTSAVSYLNALAIEEYASSITMLNPANLYVEPVDRTSVNLSWSDRTNNESAAGGYELVRATDSLFTAGVTTISLPANTTSYKNTGLAANTKYFYRIRAKSGSVYSGYSNRAKTITPSAIVYVNFNTTVPNAATPWNNLAASPLSAFTINGLKNQAGTATAFSIKLEQVFNGEFTAGVKTGNNSGIAPDLVQQSDYWLDKLQLSTFRISGLNQTKRYRFGFLGSSSTAGWFKGNYTCAYSINARTVYLNSWMNSSKIVYIGDVVPNTSGQVVLNFSTTSTADYGFNAGIVIEEYGDSQGGTVVNTATLDLQDSLLVNETKLAIYPNPFTDLISLDFFNP
ncbi:MAG: fibronectin type III domain-containing protein, partial [Flavitalea sp.]